MLRNIIILTVSSSVLVGCALLPGSPAPTPYPAGYIPTVVYLTALAIDSAAQTANPPTLTPTATSTFLPPTLAPTLTPTPGPGVPLAAIQVRAPGPMSRVVSPLQVQLLAIAGDSHRIEIDLFGEDGRLLGRSLVAVPGSELGDTLSVKVPFEIRAAGETGYVQVSTRDIGGRIQSLVTVPVLLLSSGESQINPAGNTIYERVALCGSSGGIRRCRRRARDRGRGSAVQPQPGHHGTRQQRRDKPQPSGANVSGADWQAVETTLPYRVDKVTPARLYVRQADDLFGGDGYVFSLPLNLVP